MASLFIAVIYLAFISLGLPDSLLGSAWPVMHTELGASLSSAGVISLIISLSTINEVLGIRSAHLRPQQSEPACPIDIRSMGEKQKTDTICKTVADFDGNISKAAKKLNVSRNTIYRYLSLNEN